MEDPYPVENIKRLCVFMFQTWDNSQLCTDSQYSSQQLSFVWILKHHISQPIYIFNRARVLHLDRLKEGTSLHSFAYKIKNTDLKIISSHCALWTPICKMLASMMTAHTYYVLYSTKPLNDCNKRRESITLSIETI